MNTGDVIQIEAPDFDPDIDEVLPISMDQHTNGPVTQGSVTPILKSAEKVITCMSWPEKSGYFIFFIFPKHCK